MRNSKESCDNNCVLISYRHTVVGRKSNKDQAYPARCKRSQNDSSTSYTSDSWAGSGNHLCRYGTLQSGCSNHAPWCADPFQCCLQYEPSTETCWYLKHRQRRRAVRKKDVMIKIQSQDTLTSKNNGLVLLKTTIPVHWSCEKRAIVSYVSTRCWSRVEKFGPTF